MDRDEQKRAAGRAAANLVHDGMTVGLGSGSTAREFVRELGKHVKTGLNICGVASSRETARLAQCLGIRLVDHEAAVDIAVDGADAVARDSLAAIKGLGGAMVRERLVAQSAIEFVLIVDESKIHERLEDSQPDTPIPVEILPFGWRLTFQRLAMFGNPRLRTSSDGKVFETDNGNMIADLFGGDYTSLNVLARDLKLISGVVDHGLFLNIATSAIVATPRGIETHKLAPR